MKIKEIQETIIEVIENGPLRITGNISLTDGRRSISSEVKEVWLCRCGKSENKPYCDGSHKRGINA
jgi:CDGSH-type Zn-finger protein